MKLAIVGSTRLEGSKDAYQTILNFVSERADVVTEIVSGGARGVDSIAEMMSEDILHKQATVFKPEYQAWPAFKKRNLQIAEYCDALLRVVSHKSKTYGSGWTRDRAKEMGKPTWEVVIYD